MLAVGMLVMASLACQMDLGGPHPPGGSTALTSPNQETSQQAWASALSSADSQGDFTLSLDEGQLTSLIAGQFREQADPPLKDPRVFLRDGKLQVYGIVQRSYFQANAAVGITPQVNPDGQLSLEVTSAQIGPVPMPESVKKAISSAISEAFTGSLGSLATGIEIKSLTVADGKLTLVGKLR